MKNSMLTYITGQSEILRDPLVITPNTEYICVTDNKRIKSKVWKVVYDSNIAKSSLSYRDRTAAIKFNPFKYTTGSRVIIVDGSHQQYADATFAFDACENTGLLLKNHPQKVNAYEELFRWIIGRNLPSEQAIRFRTLASVAKVDLSAIKIYEGCCIGVIRSPSIQKLFTSVLSVLQKCGSDNIWFMSNQITLSFLVHLLKVPHETFVPSTIFNRYTHNGWVKNNE